MSYIPGQRWVSHADAQLGLGIILTTEGRRVTLSFPAVGEQRTYALDNAPLTRLRFKAGDHIRTQDERELTVEEVHEHDGLLYYSGLNHHDQSLTISELELDAFVQLTTPQQRLLNGHFDKNSAFALRVATLQHQDRLQQSPVRGLLGSRTSLLPHQLYIAAEVGSRFAPRVLLADEVGLGKTIEAGMIIHQQLLSGRSQRVLILVPPTLLHQWLVEMLRRFNLHFSLYDQERLDQYEGDNNPFEDEQLVLCSLDLFDDEHARDQLLQSHWDLTVIDEAHHLGWSEAEGGDERYCLVEQLSQQSHGLLLLTATPEQVGIASHFARLRLLDPNRFSALDRFLEEEQGFTQLNVLVEDIEAGKDVSQQLPPDINTEGDSEAIIRQLLDRHGTGRVLFRNTRAAVKGFPKRIMHTYPLEHPSEYQPDHDDLMYQLHPEQQFDNDDWLDIDPRVNWLVQTLKTLRPKKVLVICAHASTAVALEHHLHLRAGIRSAAFYEGLSIIERDRAAAYFADTEAGAQTLVCSEIGSEGRNFQFAHHLILFDLPLSPDALEQRIGRLDRIGQQQDVNIHVPYLTGSAQQRLLRWLDEGIGVFGESFSAGQAILQHFQAPLEAQLLRADDGFETLLAETSSYSQQLRDQLQQGRDRLLERSSCPADKAQLLLEQVSEHDDSTALPHYLEALCDAYGVEQEHHSEQAVILRPTDHMLTGHFPGLSDEGLTGTFDRAKALSREDMAFFSWEHPNIIEAMDMVSGTELGNAAIGTIKLKGIAAGTLLLESVFTINCASPRALQVERFLPLSPMRYLIDARGKDLAALMPHQRLNRMIERLKKATALAIIKQVRQQVENKTSTATALAQQQLETRQQQALNTMQQQLGNELSRLQALQEVNPSVRPEEIAHLQWRMEESAAHISHATLQLQALRLIVTT